MNRPVVAAALATFLILAPATAALADDAPTASPSASPSPDPTTQTDFPSPPIVPICPPGQTALIHIDTYVCGVEPEPQDSRPDTSTPLPTDPPTRELAQTGVSPWALALGAVLVGAGAALRFAPRRRGRSS
jgi:hypothetical protein